MIGSAASTLALVGSLFAAQASAQETSSVSSSQNVPKFRYGTPNANAEGVVGANKNGPTNPDQPSLNTPINQSE